MSKLLFDEAPLVVLPTLAKAIGLNEAIILQQINYWMRNERSGKLIDGKRWIYNSLSEWKEQFPFWSESTIYRALEALEKRKLIETGNYNQRRYDKTKWYTLNYAAYAALEAEIATVPETPQVSEKEPEPDQEQGGVETTPFNMEQVDSERNGSRQNETTIPETSPEISSEISSVVEDPITPNDFEKVWKEVEQVFIVVNSTDFMKFRELWERFPQFERHNYAIAQARKTNPKQFRFYLKDFASFDPNAPRTWGNQMTSSSVPNGIAPLVSAAPIHAMVLRVSGEPDETVAQTLQRLFESGKLKKEMYETSISVYAQQLESPTDRLSVPSG